jgi:mono/diheme cytochrome c family protein
MKNTLTKYTIALLLVVPLSAISAPQDQDNTIKDGKPATPVLTEQQKSMLELYTPELQQRVLSLSPEILGRFAKGERSGKNQFEQQFTARQVMQQMLSDFQAIAASLALDNGKMAAENARRLINHPSPTGHVYPYVALDRINDANFSALPTMYEAVFGNAKKLAAAADEGNIPLAASYFGSVMSGCIACHQIFRGTPGVSNKLRANGAGTNKPAGNP